MRYCVIRKLARFCAIELNTLVSMIGCTTFLLTNSHTPEDVHPEHTMVDGLIELTDELIGKDTSNGASPGVEVPQVTGVPAPEVNPSFDYRTATGVISWDAVVRECVVSGTLWVLPTLD